jgi:hypothetical protein
MLRAASFSVLLLFLRRARLEHAIFHVGAEEILR